MRVSENTKSAPAIVSMVDDVEAQFRQAFSSLSSGTECTRDLDKWLQGQNIRFADKLLPTFFTPHIVSREAEISWSSSLNSLLELFERVGRAVLEDDALLRTLELPPGSRKLLEIEPGYSRLLVSCRMDAVWSENHALSVLEVNADSPAMMTYTDRLEDYQLQTSPLRQAFAGVEPANRTRGLYDAMRACYREWGGTNSAPTIAIVDWRGEKTAGELIHTAMDFERFGSPTVICDPRELRIENGKLHAGDYQIDILQRRVLFPDFIKREAELKPLLDTCTRGLACVVNPLRGYVLGNKLALALVCRGRELLGFSDEEVRVVESVLPTTLPVDERLAELMIADRENWVLKGAFGAGGDSVILGTAVDDAAWKSHVRAAINEPAIGQRRQKIPTLHIPQVADQKIVVSELYANWNPWFFGGRYHGASTRVSDRQLVSIQSGGGLLPSIAV